MESGLWGGFGQGVCVCGGGGGGGAVSYTSRKVEHNEVG